MTIEVVSHSPPASDLDMELEELEEEDESLPVFETSDKSISQLVYGMDLGLEDPGSESEAD